MDGCSTAKDHLLFSFPPRLRNNIKEIWIDGKVGISSVNIKLRLCSTKMSSNDYNAVYNDNFVLEIPYGGKQLYWEVIFQDEDYDYPPDFDFNDETFLCDPDINIITEFIPSLAKWNVDNPKSLICVIRELLQLYKSYQIMKLKSENGFSRFYAEYELLQSDLDDANNVEVYVENGTIHFLIFINVNFSLLPPFMQPVLCGEGDKILHPHEDTATLRISVLKLDASKVQCKLQLSPHLEDVLGPLSSLHIPNYNKTDELSNYVSQITKLLKDRVEQISNQYKLKSEYMSYLLTTCGNSIMEYDNTLFTKAALLVEVKDFYVLVSINIGNKFPHEKPNVTLHSVYHLKYEKVIPYIIDNYPYSPRWKPNEMVKKLLTNLQEEIPKFQLLCQNSL